jgi:hypothetical protein
MEHNHHRKPEDFRSGELIITGHDKVSIDLTREPCRVFVKFLDDHFPAPCNPTHHDDLEWEVKKTHHHRGNHHAVQFDLVIAWKVAGTRKVYWSVEFA